MNNCGRRGGGEWSLDVRTIFHDLLLADLDPAQRTVLWRVGLTAALVFHVSWACGWIPGMTGFAMAADYHFLAEKVDSIELSLLEEKIIEAQERLCRADAENNVPAMRYSAERLRELVYEYESMTGKIFRVPQCNELGIQ